MGSIISFRKRARRTDRRRGWLESPWIIPGIIAAGAAAYVGMNAAPNALSLMSSPTTSAARITFGVCGIIRRTCVVDGDTLWIGGTKVRMADIDAPEVSEPRCALEKALGDRATRRLVELLNSGTVSVVRSGRRNKDQYGRQLRLVLVNGRSAGSTLVSEGLARPWDGKRRPWC